MRAACSPATRFGLASSLALVAGCGSPPPLEAPLASNGGAASSAAASPEPRSLAAGYPATYPVLDDAELSRRTTLHEAKTPGWTIELDPFGLLSSATCTCMPRVQPSKGNRLLTAEDRAQVEAFLSAQRDITALEEPSVVKKFDRDSGVFYQQVTKSGIAGWLQISPMGGEVKITGHMWPVLPAVGTWLPDAELEPKLHALDTSPDLLLTHGYARIARSDAGPLEIHEAVCLTTTADTVPGTPHPNRPCLDARTGEDLTALKVGWTVSAKNGRVTSRKLNRTTP